MSLLSSSKNSAPTWTVSPSTSTSIAPSESLAAASAGSMAATAETMALARALNAGPSFACIGLTPTTCSASCTSGAMTTSAALVVSAMSSLAAVRSSASAPTSSTRASGALRAIFLSDFQDLIPARTSFRTSPAEAASASSRTGSGHSVRWTLLTPTASLNRAW